MNISIIGGGPGGLTLARLLQQKGATVKVYERDKNRQVRVQGSTLDLHTESGLKALEAAGLIENFKQKYRPDADLVRVADSQANIVHDQQQGESGTFGDPWFRPEIDRGPLRDLLLDSLQSDTVVWDSQLRSLEKQPAGWSLTFENNHTAHADLVIGADGANSRVRRSITSITPIYSGITVIEGTVYEAAKNAPRLTALTKGGKIFALGDNKTLITSAKEDGGLSFYAGFHQPQTWVKDSGLDFTDPRQLLQWFKKEFTGWAPIWEELFTNGRTNFIPRPQYYMPLDQSWEPHADITLIGDAAHVMPPYAGEGVNMAMLDALELSECLTCNELQKPSERQKTNEPQKANEPRKAIELPQAIAAYEKNMRKRTKEIAAMTLEQTAALHSPGALQNLLKIFAGE